MSQARRVGRALRSREPTAIYSSPLPRALKSAEMISRELSLEVTQVEGLMELDLGELEGITGPEMRERYRWVFDAWREDPSQVTFPGGESLGQLQARAWKVVEEIEKAHPDGVVVAVSHNFAIGTVLCRLLGLPLSQFRCLQIDLGSITTFETNPNSRYLMSFNDLCHLAASPRRA